MDRINIKKNLKIEFLFLFIFLGLVKLNAAETDFLKVAQNYADAIIKYCPDRYGIKHTAMWAQIIDLRTLKIPGQRNTSEWKEEMASWQEDENYSMWGKHHSNLEFAGMSNLNWDGSNIRLMNALTELTGEQRYKNAADNYIQDFYNSSLSPVNGLFAWGMHMAYDMRKDTLYWHRHELQWWDPQPWKELWKVNSKPVLDEINGIYSGHFQDKKTYVFDRHAEFYVNAYPFESNCYVHHGLMYAEAFAFAYTQTHDQKYLRWAIEFLTSVWSKRQVETDKLPWNWMHDLEKDGHIHEFMDKPWMANILFSAYETSGEEYFKEIAEAYLLSKGKRVQASVKEARDARALLRGYRLLHHKQFLELAVNYAKTIPEKIKTPAMAFNVADNLLLLLELFQVTGEQSWYLKAKDYAEQAVEMFVHESGFLVGTAGVNRPLYYDVAQGPGLLAGAFFRLGLLEKGLLPVDVEVEQNSNSESVQIKITCRNSFNVESNPVCIIRDDRSLEKEIIIESKKRGNKFYFLIPTGIVNRSSHVRFTIADTKSLANFNNIWYSQSIGSDKRPPEITDIVIPAEAEAGEQFFISARVDDISGIDSVRAKILIDNAFGYPLTQLTKKGGLYSGHIKLPENRIPQNVSIAVQAFDASKSHNSVHSSWYNLKVLSRDTFQNEIETVGKTTGVSVKTINEKMDSTITIQRYWWWPEDEELLPSETTIKIYYHVEGANKQLGKTTLTFPYTLNQIAEFVETSLIVLHKTKSGWEKLPTNVDIKGKRLTVSGNQLDGYFTVTGQSRLIWSQEAILGTSASPMFLDLDKDGTAEIVGGAGGHQIWAVSAMGEKLWVTNLGQPFRHGGGTFSNIAGIDILGDYLPEILIGSEDGGVHCLDASGNHIWRYGANGQVRSGIAIDKKSKKENTLICFSDATGFLYLINTNGELVWKKQVGTECYTTPVFRDVDNNGISEIFCGTRDDELLALDINGNILWKKRLDGDVSSPAVGSFNINDSSVTSIVAGTSGGMVWAFNANGELLWSRETPPPLIEGWNEPEIIMTDLDMDGMREVVMTTKRGELLVLDSLGNIKWSYKTKNKIFCSAISVDLSEHPGLELVFSSYDGYVYALTNAGDLLWKYGEKANSPGFSLIGDVNGDGLKEVLVYMIGGLHLLRTNRSSESYSYPYWTYHGNLARTGCR